MGNDNTHCDGSAEKMVNPADTEENRTWINRVNYEFICGGQKRTEAQCVDNLHQAINERFPGGRGGVGIAMGRHAANLRRLIRTIQWEMKHERFEYPEPTVGYEF